VANGVETVLKVDNHYWYNARGHNLNFYVGWAKSFFCPPSSNKKSSVYARVQYIMEPINQPRAKAHELSLFPKWNLGKRKREKKYLGCRKRRLLRTRIIGIIGGIIGVRVTLID
jgi:hypothetical protein